jgi:hypothetical protein
MPKNKVSDPITDQEMAFALLVQSGRMTDRQAAEAVGLNPDSAAYIKSKPSVRAYMLEHRAAVEQQLVQQEADGLHRLNLDREKVLNRLWEIATLSSEMTRNSITGQVKALSMIVAMLDLIPDRRAGSAQKEPAPTPANAKTNSATWSHGQQAETLDPPPNPASPVSPVPACRGAQQEHEDEPGVPDTAPGSAAQAPPDPGPSPSAIANRLTPSSPHARVPDSAPDNRIPSSLEKNPSTWRLRL